MMSRLTSVNVERSSVTWSAWNAASESRPQVFRRTDPLQFAEFRLLRESGCQYSDLQSQRLTVEGDVRAEAFDSLHLLSSLYHLRMSHLDLAGADLSSAGQMTLLHSLRFDESSLDDAALQSIAPLPNLETLSVDHTQVTSTGLQRLVHQPSLRFLTIRGLAVDESVINQLRDARPDLEIVRR
jgi:hypothetical protein